jgi:predicted acetyltransferase
VEPAAVSADEVPALIDAVYTSFHFDLSPERVERLRRAIEPERTLALRDRGRIVAATAIYSRRMTVPGGEAPVAGVTLVGVLPTHRRRGMLTALMKRQLAAVQERGEEAIAALWASESVIYGRYGYGLASMAAELQVSRHHARLRAPSAPAAAELLRPADAIKRTRAIYDAARRQRVGMLDREGPWWEERIADPEDDRDGAGPLRAAVVGEEAYALYAVKSRWEDGLPAAEAVVREVVATGAEGNAAIWSFLLGLDLTGRITYKLAPVDDSLPHMLTEARAAKVTVGDALWVRLVDVPRALGERTYAQPFEVVLEVADDVCPWNAGRWALRWDGTAADCASTALPAAIELSAAELGAVYLGGTTLDELARGGRVRELRGGAVVAASVAFREARAPWCPEIF